MAVLAVLVAAVTLLGHRAHTEEIILQTRSADQWAYYQAKEIRRRNYELFLDELSVFSLQDAKQMEAVKEKYAKEIERYTDELKEIEAEAKKGGSRSESRRSPRGSLRSGGSAAGSRASDIVHHAANAQETLLDIWDRALAHWNRHRRYRLDDSLARYC